MGEKRPPADTILTMRIVGEAVDPDAITARLGLAPTRAHHKGEPISPRVRRPRPFGVWLLDSPLGRDRPLEEHLDVLLGLLEPRAEALRSLAAEGCPADLFSGHFMQRYNTGIELSPGVLGRVAALGLALDIDIYDSPREVEGPWP